MKKARVSDNDSNHKFVWRDDCANDIYGDHEAGCGFEWSGDDRNFIGIAKAVIRKKPRDGFVMLSYPDGNKLQAQWDVEIAKGSSMNIQFAMTDMAVKNSTNGLKFIVIAIDSNGLGHVLVSQLLLPGDETVYDRHCKFDYDIKNIKFVHDNLGQEAWDVLWFYPEIKIK